MRQFIQNSSLIVASALLLAACGRQSAVDEQLQKDLEAAAVGTLELAPSGPGTKVVSAIESKQPLQPKVTPTRQTMAPAKTPPPVTPQVTNTSNTEPTANRPATRPAVQPPPPGGYKTVDEVIRNAPFPIKPATKRP